MLQTGHTANNKEMAPPFPQARTVPPLAPLRWLARGYGDLKSCPGPSLFYGFCFAMMGWLMTWVFEHAYAFALAMTSGFLLLGPFLAMGLYEISRRHELDQGCNLPPTLTVWKRNTGNIGVFAVVLGILFIIWARVSLIVFALFYTSEVPNLTGFLKQIIAIENLEFLVIYSCVGLVFAIIAFAGSVVSLPLMLDRNQDAASSMLGSVNVLLKNPLPMIVWAGTIVSLTLVGFLTFHLGLVVLMPLLGHATWHAYRDLVEPLQNHADP